MIKWLPLVCLSASLLLSGCEGEDPNSMPLAQYEGDIGEAIVRHIIQSLPEISPGVPKVYCVVKGEIDTRGVFDPISAEFTKRFDDLKLHFVSANVLTHSEPDHVIIEPQTRLAPYVLQVRKIVQTEPEVWEAETAWSYKKLYERYRCRVVRDGGRYEVTECVRLEGNYVPAEAAR